MTARYHVAVVSFNPSTGDLVTRASGEMLVGVVYMLSLAMWMYGGEEVWGLGCGVVFFFMPLIRLLC